MLQKGTVSNDLTKKFTSLVCFSLMIIFSQVVDSLRQGHQAMVFVHSRKDTVKTAEILVQ